MPEVLKFILSLPLLIGSSINPPTQPPTTPNEIQQEETGTVTETTQSKYSPSEVLVKFRAGVEIEAKTVDKEREAFSTSDLNMETPQAQEVFSFLQQNRIEKLEKVFKGSDTPKAEIKKLKQRFPQRKINEPELLKIDLSQTYKLTLPQEESVEDKVKELSTNPLVKYAEPNYICKAQLTPNDPEFPKLWGLHNTGQTGGKDDADIDAPEAWDITTGSDDIIVGVVDTGINYNHPDLTGNIWINQTELNGSPGIDDDGNGYIDDIRGWDFVNGDNNPTDDNGHGTHVAGTIGAIGDNNRGVAGVAWKTKLMVLKFLDRQGFGSADGAAAAIKYAVNMGAQITNNSWGLTEFSQTIKDAIQYASGADSLFVAAAGNDSSNNDLRPHYPSNYDLPNIISVAATDHQDRLASFSNSGLETVDLAAPGKDILSTSFDLDYISYSGTSMATPHVTGASVLVRSRFPDLASPEIRRILLGTTDTVPLLTGKLVSGGRLNVRNAVTASGLLYTPKGINTVLNKDASFKRTISLTNISMQSIVWDLNFGDVLWLTVNKTSGTINALAGDYVEITIDSTDLEAGEHVANLHFTTNSTQLPEFTVPISLTVSPEYTFRWGKNIGGSEADSSVGAVLDNLKNTYVLGNFKNQVDFGITQLQTVDKDDQDVFLAKYDQGGETQWVKQIGNNGSFQTGQRISVSKSDGIYITGDFYDTVSIDEQTINSNGPQDLFVAKFDPSGDLLWLRGINDEESNYLYIKAIGVDSGDNYYVGANIANKNYLMKFDDSGRELWRKETGLISGMVIGEDDYIYATGSFPLAKYDPSGNEIFRKENVSRFGGGNAITLDNSDNVYVTGYYNILISPLIDPENRDILIAKYDSEGNPLWEKRIYGPIGCEYGDAIATDEEGNVYASGRYSGDIYIDGEQYTNGAEPPFDVYMTIFRSDGQLLYFESLGNRSYAESISSILVDQLRNIYLLGTFNSYLPVDYDETFYSNGKSDLFLLKLKNEIPLPDFPTPENPGEALYINHNSYIEIPDADQKLIMAPNFTLEFWLKPELNPNNYTSQTIIKRSRQSADDFDFHLYHYPKDLTGYKYSRLTFSIGSNSWSSKKDIPLSKWVHIALTRTNKKVDLYLDGEFIQEIELPTSDPIPKNPTDALYLGSEVFEGGITNLQFKGTLDEIRISNISRDVEKSWSDGNYFQPLPADKYTLGLWRFEHNLEDSSQNSNDGVNVRDIGYVDGIVPKVDFDQALKLDPQKVIGQAPAYVEVPTAEKTKMSENFTAEAWVKPDEETLNGDNVTNPHIIFAKEGIPNEAWGYSLAVTNKKAEFGVNLKKPDGSRVREVLSGVTNLAKDKWHFIQTVKEGHKLSLFVNGRIEAEKEIGAGAEQEATLLTIGCAKVKDFPVCLGQFYGEIDEVRLSNIARGNTVPLGPSTVDESTIAIWHFNGDASDTSSNNLDGNLYGNVVFAESDISLPLTTIVGDLDNSGVSDTQDAKILLENWGGTPQNSPVDLNADGVANGLDFGEVLKLIE